MSAKSLRWSKNDIGAHYRYVECVIDSLCDVLEWGIDRPLTPKELGDIVAPMVFALKELPHRRGRLCDMMSRRKTRRAEEDHKRKIDDRKDNWGGKLK